MDREALPAALQQPLVIRAVEELKMLLQTDQERERYEARHEGPNQLKLGRGKETSQRGGLPIPTLLIYR